ncbi:MAG: hypothetical protein RIQ89_1935 [Bacteroidota bacterium]|jgi:inward rectifier potassium channel
MALKIFKENAFKEFGFGDNVNNNNQRLMNANGSSNVKRIGINFFESQNFYHSLITMRWWKFNLLILAYFLIVNCIFALFYCFITPNGLAGLQFNNNTERFLENFFFSAQTLTTVGYGRISPIGSLASAVAAIESLLGLLGFALATGLLYGRFSRPEAKLAFSENFLIAPYRDINALMFRFGNKRISELINCEVDVTMAFIEVQDGKPIRKFIPLKLELTKINFLTMSWTIVHPIDQESPIYGWSENEFHTHQVEILVLFKGIEETFVQNVHYRTSYHHHQLVYGAKFKPIISTGKNGGVDVALHHIGEYQKIELN